MIIPKELIKAMASLAADKRVPRPDIRAVRLERAGGQARAVATNSRVLTVAQWREPSAADLPFPLSAIEGERRDFEASVAIEDWKALVPMAPTARDLPILEAVAVSERASGGRLEAGSFDLETEQRRQVRTLSQAYPNWRSVMPEYRIAGDEANAIGVLVSAERLADLLKAFVEPGPSAASTAKSCSLCRLSAQPQTNAKRTRRREAYRPTCRRS